MKLEINRKDVAYIFSIIGILIGLYLTYGMLTNTSAACPNTGAINCGTVLDSKYATILGIPNPYLGILFFVIEIALLYKLKNSELLVLYNAIGLGFVLYFVNVERILGAICIYCTFTHIIVVTLFILSFLDLRNN